MIRKPLGVITVTYSPGQYLGEFLGSLPAAYERGSFVVLADNGSTDGVPQAAAAREANVHFLPTGGNLGYGTAVNIGVSHLQPLRDAGEIDSEFFVISNPDVVFNPGALDTLVECMHRWPKAAAVGPRIVEPDGSSYPSARAVPTLGKGIGHALLGSVWRSNPWSKAYRNDSDMSSERTAGWLSGSCLLVRYSAFEAVGGFDERYFMYMEDVDLGDRFARAGYVNVFCPLAEITHAKGHSAGQHPETMLPAHHESAYRFQADRLPHWWQRPIRIMLKVGLKVRAAYAVVRAQKRKGN